MSGVGERTVVRIAVVGLVVLLMMGALVARLWYLQVLSGDTYAQESFRNYVRIDPVPAPRGFILDRNGVPIVTNAPFHTVAIRREDFYKGGHCSATNACPLKARLAKLLNISVASINDCLKDPQKCAHAPLTVGAPLGITKDDVPRDVISYIAELQDEFPGVEVQQLPLRNYPQGSLAAQVLGYVNEVTPQEYKGHPYGPDDQNGYVPGDLVGRSGLEAEYDHQIVHGAVVPLLRGIDGQEKVQVDASGNRVAEINRVPYVAGDNLQLTLDAKIQKVAEESIAQAAEAARARVDTGTHKHFPAPAGAAVVLDANTGGVVAMASYPTFDLSQFVGGVSNSYFQTLNDPKAHQPLLNRAIGEGGASYPPGSTFKPLMAVAALSTGLASYDGRYPCTSEFKFGTGVFHNWEPSNANISLGQSLVQSCDTVFYRFAQQWWLREDPLAKAGKQPYEAMQDYARRFGLGRATGVDLQGETSGRIPDRAYRRDVWNANKKTYCQNYEKTKLPLWEDLCFRGFYWDGGDSVITSIGQGDVLVTPLQMAVAYAALANGGTLLVPHLVSKITSPDGKIVKVIGPQVRSHVRVSPGVLDYVDRALAGVPAKGTAQAVFAGWPLDRIPVAAKTGTSQITGAEPYSWFASFAPDNGHPSYVVVAVIERAGFGAQVAGPTVRRIMDALFGRPLTRISYGVRSD